MVKMLISIFLLVFVSSCIDLPKDEEKVLDSSISNEEVDIVSNQFYYFPTSTTQAVYERKSFVFSYSEEHEQSEWVAYFLTPSDFKKGTYDRPFFIEDPLVKTVSADWRNYKKSGYDKGHLCPAGDRKSSYDSFKETFYTSNITPQKRAFNSGIWNRLEEKTRYWAEKYNGIYVVTGGVLSDNLKTIGKEKVSVPNYFYKVLMTKDKSKMIAFLIPHEDSKLPLYEYVVTVNEVEKITGIDFFPRLADTIEDALESKNDYKIWSF